MTSLEEQIVGSVHGTTYEVGHLRYEENAERARVVVTTGRIENVAPLFLAGSVLFGGTLIYEQLALGGAPPGLALLNLPVTVIALLVTVKSVVARGYKASSHPMLQKEVVFQKAGGRGVGTFTVDGETVDAATYLGAALVARGGARNSHSTSLHLVFRDFAVELDKVGDKESERRLGELAAKFVQVAGGAVSRPPILGNNGIWRTLVGFLFVMLVGGIAGSVAMLVGARFGALLIGLGLIGHIAMALGPWCPAEFARARDATLREMKARVTGSR